MKKHVSILMITVLTLLTSCNKENADPQFWQEEAAAEYWQVTWNLNGGSWPPGDNHATQALKGGTLAEPNEPVKTGGTFKGWYREAALTNKVSFPYDVSGLTNNFTLYAKWEMGNQSGNISLNKASLTIHTTDRERLTITSASGDNPTVIWSTSNKDVAIVNHQGVVTATGAGNAVITATVGSKSVDCDVEVIYSVITGIGTAIWKNGEKIEIMNYNAPKDIRSVFVYRGDIYITGTKTDVMAGSTTITEYSRAVVIKVECAIKGELNTLIFTDQLLETKGNASYGEDIFISANGDIYVTGYEISTNEYNNYYHRSVLWKNAKLQPVLSNSNMSQNAVARSVFVSDNDVYIVGNYGYYVDDGIWKNGLFELLERPQGDIARLKASSVFVSGDDVYVAGAAYYYGKYYSVPKAVLWKNNVPAVLGTGEAGSELYSVFVSGNDVYVAGHGGLWKNNDLMFDERVNDVCVYNEDVYASGDEDLWINGVKQYWGAGKSVVVK
ncbi:MAG: InlB B-repeat-containing protein [Tannerella sp.]|jgi:uncharacterized repeat protein (TIGR02543 family)|nr:InlB B-repeat-containing protein [Tannerella sp.]